MRSQVWNHQRLPHHLPIFITPGNYLPIDTHRSAMRVVAMMEAVKGVIVLGAGFGLLTLLHRDVAHIAVSLVTRLNIDPDEHYAGVFLDAAYHVTNKRLLAGAALAALYSAVRLAEGYGLWFERRWAEWLGAFSGAIYVPVELYELWHKPSLVKAGTLTLNVAVVAYLVWILWDRRTKGESAKAQEARST